MTFWILVKLSHLKQFSISFTILINGILGAIQGENIQQKWRCHGTLHQQSYRDNNKTIINNVTIATDCQLSHMRDIKVLRVLCCAGHVTKTWLLSRINVTLQVPLSRSLQFRENLMSLTSISRILCNELLLFCFLLSTFPFLSSPIFVF